MIVVGGGSDIKVRLLTKMVQRTCLVFDRCRYVFVVLLYIMYIFYH